MNELIIEWIYLKNIANNTTHHYLLYRMSISFSKYLLFFLFFHSCYLHKISGNLKRYSDLSSNVHNSSKKQRRIRWSFYLLHKKIRNEKKKNERILIPSYFNIFLSQLNREIKRKVMKIFHLIKFWYLNVKIFSINIHTSTLPYYASTFSL